MIDISGLGWLIAGPVLFLAVVGLAFICFPEGMGFLYGLICGKK